MKSKFACLSLVALSLGIGSLVLADSPPAIKKADAAPALPFPSDDQFPGQGPIPNSAWFKKVWSDRRAHFAKTKPLDHGAVVFLGDSITQGWGSLAKDFPDLKVANRGIGGDMSRGVWQRLDEDVLDLEPAAIVLLIGTNDIGAKGEPEDIARNVKAILKAIHAKYSKLPVIVCKVMPSSATKDRPADQIKKLNALVDKIVKAERHCVRCDTWSIYANDQGDAKVEEFKDLLHPNAAGYAKWTAALQPIFAKLKLKS